MSALSGVQSQTHACPDGRIDRAYFNAPIAGQCKPVLAINLLVHPFFSDLRFLFSQIATLSDKLLGRLLMPGLFDGEHTFTIETLEANRIRFTQREVFTGLLVPLFARGLDTDTRRGFEEMNQALKSRAEQA